MAVLVSVLEMTLGFSDGLYATAKDQTLGKQRMNLLFVTVDPLITNLSAGADA